MKYKTYLTLVIAKFGSRSGIPYIAKQKKVTQYLSDAYPDIPLREQVFIHIHQLSFPILCECCNQKFSKFQNFKIGFKKACSKECTQTIRKRALEQSNMIKYGVKSTNSLSTVKKKKQATIFDKYGVDHYVKTDKFKTQSKQTKEKKYGDEYYNNRTKAIETTMSKYGVDYYTQTTTSRNNISRINKLNALTRNKKREDTNLLKYGDSNYQLEQARLTFQKKYDTQSPLHTSSILLKIQKKIMTNYNSLTPFHSKQIQQKIKKSNILKFGVDNYMKTPQARIQMGIVRFSNFNSKLTDSGFKLLTPPSDFNGVKKMRYLFECQKCLTVFEDKIEWRIPRCPKCSPYTKSSVEDSFERFLIDSSIKYIKNDRKLISPQEIDFVIDDICIEINGNYWHSELAGNKHYKYHYDKTEKINLLGKQLIHVKDSDWLYSQEIIKSMILHKLNLTNNTIYARKTTVQILDIDTKKKFLNIHHIQGNDRSSTNIGLYFEEKLVAVMTFRNTKYGIYLSRYTTQLNTLVVGGFTKLLKYFELHYANNDDRIYTHADRNISDGRLYMVAGFTKSHLVPPSYCYTYNYKDLFHKSNYTKQKIENNVKLHYDKNKTEWEMMQYNGYDRIWDSGKICFEKRVNNGKK